jgi:hypothetical protein
MALTATKTAVAITVQSVAGTFNAPTTSDLTPCANASLNLAGVTTTNPEYTGTVQQNGDIVTGKTVSISFTVLLRPPGGAAPPAAGAFIPGRILRAAKFNENVVSAAIPVTPEPIGGAATTSQVTLGTTAAATLDLYKGLPLLLSDNAGGAYPKAITAIRSYSAAKVAVLPEILAAAPAANYQIPKCLSYQRDATSTDPLPLSIKIWLDGHRYDLVDMMVSSLSFNFPTATRTTQEFPSFTVTLSGDLFADADEATPTITGLGAVPVFRDGDLWLAQKAIGGSSVSVDMNPSVGYPANPNKASGNDPPQLTALKPVVNLTKQHTTKAAFDAIALADAQAYHALWAQWGYTAGAMVSFIATDCRLNYRTPNIGQEFVDDTGDLLVDVAAKNLNLTFVY